ncbi:MAG: amidohydrolase family protein [Actinomycetota bacterium]
MDVTLISGAVVFDSRAGTLTGPSHVLVKDGLIDSVTSESPAVSEGATVIDGTGKTLIPGLIDAHWHAAFASIPLNDAMTADPGYVHLVAGRGATETLLRGFTSVRDAGGPTFGLKRAIEAGVLQGPRIYPSGAFISQSGGHGDFRMPYETPRGICGHLSHMENLSAVVLADGVPEVLRGVREQLMHGASQIKVMAGGGVASNYDPIDVTEYTFDEMRAAVETAENFGTYVMVHAYTPRAVRQALKAGVRCIDHGHLLDDATVALIAEKGAWWSLQPFLDDADADPMTGENRVKQLQVAAGTDQAYALAKKHGIQVAWGTDTLFTPELASRQGEQLAKMVRWFTPAEILMMATRANAELLALSGPRNPYPGTLGVIEAGAIADLLLIDGDPLADITLIERPETSMSLIMKGGEIVKKI